MLPSDGLHYRCAWIEDSVTIHCDGNVTCGLDDPHGQRSFGNIHSQSIAGIFSNPEYRRLQNQLWSGRRCRDCGHFRRAEESKDPRGETRAGLPGRLVVETTVKCNIRCPNPPCLANNEPTTRTRDKNSLPFEAFKRVADELAGRLHTVLFYNYGEPFVNREAETMLGYLRERCPEAYILTSTNGVLLADAARAKAVVAAAPDHITFTISGVTQTAYARYHVRGQLAKALTGLRNVCEAKQAGNRALPKIVWRYLVFHWNDSDEEIEQAISLAKQYGVDVLSLYLTNTPAGVRSVRFSPGSPSFLKYRNFIHRDDEGRLDHEYHCELPNQAGVYHLEELPGLGKARWTASRAIVRCNVQDGCIRLAVSLARPTSPTTPYRCRIRLPWVSFVVSVRDGEWTELSIDVPAERADEESVEVEITAEDYWFPAVEVRTADLRCLGVLVRVDESRSFPSTSD